jgi:hypothetical protein
VLGDGGIGCGRSELGHALGSLLTRLIPATLASRCYTRWLAQISNYLSA